MPPVVDTKKCKGAAACAEVCPANVIDIVKGKAVVARPADCIECRACEAACPNNAISFP
ncbi:MAG: ferredoxin family protein [Hadesarchaea archaeon]|nr:ferredoxin family protein [Hadesarchaea archaeon]